MMKSSVFWAAQTFNRLRSTLNTGAVHAGARQPFKFLLCGDPGQVAAFRSVLLTGTGADTIPLDAAANKSNARRISDPAAATPVFVLATDEEAMIAYHTIKTAGLARARIA